MSEAAVYVIPFSYGAHYIGQREGASTNVHVLNANKRTAPSRIQPYIFAHEVIVILSRVSRKQTKIQTQTSGPNRSKHTGPNSAADAFFSRVAELLGQLLLLVVVNGEQWHSDCFLCLNCTASRFADPLHHRVWS